MRAKGKCASHYVTAFRNRESYNAYMRDYQRKRYAKDADFRRNNRDRVIKYRRGLSEDKKSHQRMKANMRRRERYQSDTEYRDRKRSRNDKRTYRVHKRVLLTKQHGLCALCGKPMGSDITIDHIYPVHLGGGDEIENLQAVHAVCNSRKKDRYDIFAVSGIV